MPVWLRLGTVYLRSSEVNHNNLKEQKEKKNEALEGSAVKD